MQDAAEYRQLQQCDRDISVCDQFHIVTGTMSVYFIYIHVYKITLFSPSNPLNVRGSVTVCDWGLKQLTTVAFRNILIFRSYKVYFKLHNKNIWIFRKQIPHNICTVMFELQTVFNFKQKQHKICWSLPLSLCCSSSNLSVLSSMLAKLTTYIFA